MKKPEIIPIRRKITSQMTGFFIPLLKATQGHGNLLTNANQQRETYATTRID